MYVWGGCLGVLASDLDIRASAKGQKFGMIKLNDMNRNAQSVMTLFLFGSAFQVFRRKNFIEGTLLFLGSPSVLPRRERDSGVALSVKDPGQFFALGKAKVHTYIHILMTLMTVITLIDNPYNHYNLYTSCHMYIQDFGYCKAYKNRQTMAKCNNVIFKGKGLEYCKFHQAAQYKAIKAHRLEVTIAFWVIRLYA